MRTPCHRAITGIAVFFVSVAATRLELFSRFCVCALPNFALASRNEKCLFGTEATLLDGRADPLSHFGRRVSKTSWNGASTHKLRPFTHGTAAVPRADQPGTAQSASSMRG